MNFFEQQHLNINVKINSEQKANYLKVKNSQIIFIYKS